MDKFYKNTTINAGTVKKFVEISYFKYMELPDIQDKLPNHWRELYIRIHYPEFYAMVNNAYPDIELFGERVYMFFHHLTEAPKCPICGKLVKFKNIIDGYKTYCSKVCANRSDEKKQSTKNTCQQKYGGVAPACACSVQNKMSATKQKRYGNANYNNRTDAMKTCTERYGGVGNHSTVIQQKQQSTMLEKYGVVNAMNSDIVKEKIRQRNIKKYGVEWVTETNGVLEKIIASKRENNTFNTSSIEEQFADYLEENKIEYKRQYKNEKYPYCCDFYIPCYDLYIEIQGTWTHGFKPFENSEEDKKKLSIWKSKHTKFYEHAIDVWTKSDVKKREQAKKEKLNYLELFTVDINQAIYEYKRFIERL